MKMDGYDIMKHKRIDPGGRNYVRWHVYTIKDKIKRYYNGYSDYKSMIAAHPELKR